MQLDAFYRGERLSLDRMRCGSSTNSRVSKQRVDNQHVKYFAVYGGIALIGQSDSFAPSRLWVRVPLLPPAASCGITYLELTQLVECHLYALEVAGPSPAFETSIYSSSLDVKQGSAFMGVARKETHFPREKCSSPSRGHHLTKINGFISKVQLSIKLNASQVILLGGTAVREMRLHKWRWAYLWQCFMG